MDPSATEDTGPGAYNNELKSLSEDAANTLARSSKKQPAFGNTSAQRLLPFATAAVPGPGAYNWDTGKQKHVSDAGSAFKSESKRLDIEANTGDPGAYDPDLVTNLAA